MVSFKTAAKTILAGAALVAAYAAGETSGQKEGFNNGAATGEIGANSRFLGTDGVLARLTQEQPGCNIPGFLPAKAANLQLKL